MSYLLDTNIISELRKAPERIDPRVVAWGGSLDASDQFLSVVTVFELELGLLLVERRDMTTGRILRRWFNEVVLGDFEDRTFDVDRKVALYTARLHVPDPRLERDALIAATAVVHGLTVATRNVADFEPMGVPVVDPWAG
ncbi:MAG: type II toxin-antitoxin system VapC family toxin [Actinobacteria bacterium]|nr:type II toxin-antitoxin system VapC family toxin [Actinomycetota bacterium]